MSTRQRIYSYEYRIKDNYVIVFFISYQLSYFMRKVGILVIGRKIEMYSSQPIKLSDSWRNKLKFTSSEKNMGFFSKVYIKKGHKIFKIQDFKNSNFLDIHSCMIIWHWHQCNFVPFYFAKKCINQILNLMSI